MNPFAQKGYVEMGGVLQRVARAFDGGAAVSAAESAVQGETTTVTIPETTFTIQPSKDVQKLNKTEKARFAYLHSQNGIRLLGVQNVTLKLADDCRLTCDFSYLNSIGQFILEDVKGFQREDALIKIKVAARLYPQFHFWIVKKDGASWKSDRVMP